MIKFCHTVYLCFLW